jgi:hypothetical protein
MTHPHSKKPENGCKAPSGVTPIYELRISVLGKGDLLLEVWQVPSNATPRLKTPERTASLKGRPLSIIETRILKRLKGAGILIPTGLGKEKVKAFCLDEDQALILALLFRTLAPMKSIERIRQVSEGIENMARDEAGYWLGMAVHRSNPRRVLAALRMLLMAT